MVAERGDVLDEETVEAMLGGKEGDAVGAAAHGSPRSESPAPRVCRICFSDETTPPDRLLSPCRCKGTMKVRFAGQNLYTNGSMCIRRALTSGVRRPGETTRQSPVISVGRRTGYGTLSWFVCSRRACRWCR